MIDYRFVPDDLVFRRGISYRLHLDNRGAEMHEFTAPEFLKTIEIRNPEAVGTSGKEIVIPPHEQKDLYFLATQAGRYELRCGDHDWAGMVGKIVVQ